MARRRLSLPRSGWLALLVGLVALSCTPMLDAEPPTVRAPDPVEVEHRPMPTVVGGEVRVAVPGEPSGGLPVDELDVAGADLLALWGLPLYEADADGRLVPALVDEATVADDGRGVELTLRPGRWSDGKAVTASDVAATVSATRELDPEGLAWLTDLEVVDPVTVRLELDRPDRRWSRLLAGIGVLPAHLLDDESLDDLDNPPAVVGGRFRPVSTEPGLRRVLEAHADGPLGRPGLDRLEVVVAPSYDTALGLLLDGEVDAIVGHLAERPQLRVEAVDDDWAVDPAELHVAAPVGGTEVALRFSDDGALGADATLRRAVRDVVDVSHQVEGLGLGRRPPSPLDGVGDPVPPEDGAREDDARQEEAPEVYDDHLAGLDAAMVVNAEQDMLASTARLVEAQVRGAGARLRVEAEPTPQDVRRAADLDVALVVRRRDRLAWERAGEQEAWEVPLYRARVAHVWRGHLQGLEPSAWAGTGLATAPWWWVDDDA
jgi:hypothetical protein